MINTKTDRKIASACQKESVVLILDNVPGLRQALLADYGYKKGEIDTILREWMYMENHEELITDMLYCQNRIMLSAKKRGNHA